MENLTQNLSKSFKDYIEKVDAFYKDKTQKVSSLFGNETPDIFFQGMSYIIRQFLESEEDYELFIQLPVDELASNQDQQEENFQKMQDAVCHTLAMATYPSENLDALPLSKASLGELYYTADPIECKNGNTRPRIWELRMGRSGSLYPFEHYPDIIKRDNRRNTLLTGNVSERRVIFDEHIKNTYRLNSLPKNYNASNQGKMKKMAELLGVYKENQTNKKFKNALLIGFGNQQYRRICDFPWISFPIDFERKYENVDKHYEIIVFAGDIKYLGRESRINNEIASGKCKKVIYIGTNKPLDYRGKNFSFTNRELYHYFADDEFPIFEIKKLSWNGLNEALNLLTDVLNDERLHLDNELKKRAITYTLTPYLGYTFFENSESINDRLLNFLNENSVLNNDQWDALVELSSGLDNISFDDNPKKKSYQTIQNEFGKKQCQLLEAYTSYPNKIKSLCNNNNKENTYVIDVCSDSNRYLDTIQYIFKKLAKGKVYLLTYFELSKIKKLLLRDSDIYNSEYRKHVLNNIEYQLVNIVDRQHYGSLDKFNFNLLDDIMTSYNNQNAVRYTVTAENGEEFDIGGDIIRFNQIINCSDLFDYAKDWLPCELSFYINPDCFQELRDILYDLPEGEDVDTYAGLWKSRLQERCRSKYNSNADMMWEQDEFKFIKRPTFKKILNGKYTSQFPNNFKRLAIQMCALDILTLEELENSLKAHKASREASSFGGKLKQGLFEYMLTNTCSVEDVNTIINRELRPNTTYTLDLLKDRCIKTTVITKIVKSKNKNNDDK